jgi:hypothetical protein
MKSLPLIDPRLEISELPSCSTISGGLSDEQLSIARRMRELKSEMRRLRRDPADERELARREQEMRREWRHLERERDAAWRRKMHALGHEV